MPSARAEEFRRAVTIPHHGGSGIGPPLFYKILSQLGISADEFRKLK